MAIQLCSVNNGELALSASQNVERVPLNNRNYYLNGTIVALSTLFQCAINNLYLNNGAIIGSKAGTSGANLFSNILFSNFNTNLLKGNWREVGSTKKQLQVLASYVLLTALCDAATAESLVPGQATATALFTAFGYLCKMSSKALLGKVTYTRGPEVETTPIENIKMRKLANMALNGFVSTCTAVGNQLIGLGTGVATLLNMGYSKCFSTLGKAAMKGEETKSAQRKQALIYGAIALASAAMVNPIFPMKSTEGKNWVHKASSNILHYLGPVVGISSLAVFTNLLPRAKNLTPSAEPVHTVKKASKVKQAVHGLLFTATNIAATGAHVLNESYNGASGAVSLGTKLMQGGWQFHSLREVLKGFPTMPGKAAVIATAAVVSSAVAGASLAAGASKHAVESVLAMGLGTAASFAGKLIRNYLLPK